MNKIKQIAALFLLFFAPVSGFPVKAQPGKNSRETPHRRPSPGDKSLSKTTPAAFDSPPLVERYGQEISSEKLASHLYLLASDLLEGRETGSRGQRLAARYLASQYRLLGLAPKGSVKKPADLMSPDAYFQPFRVYRNTPRKTILEVTPAGGGGKIVSSAFSAETSDDLSYFLSGGARSAGGSGVVFAGYGIADQSLGYDDYAALADAGISINNKWVLILGDEPLRAADASLLPTVDGKPSTWTTQFINKRRVLLRAGRPRGILVVTDASPRSRGSFAENAAAASLSARRLGQLSSYETTDMPQTYAVSTKLADQILASSGYTVETLKRGIDRKLSPVVFEVKDAAVSAAVEHHEALETENVLAFVEGSDARLKDEVIVVSSHYDHLGMNPLLKGDQIFNGAADDASGVAATLELARAFERAKGDGFGPRRSILFANFSGEEKGLLGSFHYANQDPIVPLENVVANINLDGVGGIDPKHPSGSRNYIYIAAGEEKLSGELVRINRRVKDALKSNVELTDAPAGFNSDNISFQNQLVPFIYYSTGFTEHYHQPGDEADTIDYPHLARVTRLIFGTVWQVANQDARLSGVDRSKMKTAGYVCPPCPFGCDTEIHERAGACAVCGMNLIPRFLPKTD